MHNKHAAYAHQFHEILTPLILELLASSKKEFWIVSVVAIEPNKTYEYLDISIAATHNEEKIPHEIASYASQLKQELAKNMHLKRIPILRFHTAQKKREKDEISRLLKHTSDFQINDH